MRQSPATPSTTAPPRPPASSRSRRPSSDAQSGIASHSFPAAASGWSLSGSGNARTYSHSGSPSDPAEPNNVTATNGAGLTSGATSFTVTPDATAPSGISASVTGGYYTALSIGVTLDNGSDTGSGIDAASGIVERDEAPLDNGDGTCDAFPGSWSSVTLSGGNDTTVVSGNCYRYRYLLSDRVGNQATSSASATAKVDTSAPATPTLSFGSLQAAFVAGSTVYYRPSAASGQFAVTAASTDGQSGVASYGFPAASSGWSVSGSGDTRTYSHSGSPTDPAEPNDVTAQNGAGLVSGAAGYTVTPDASAPTSSILCDGASCSGWHPASVSVTLSSSDTGSGLDEIRYTTDGSDPTPTTGTVYSGAFSVSVTTEVRYRGFDRVGNAEAIQSETIEFDTTAPSAPVLTLAESPADPDQHVAGSTVYYRPGGGRSGTFTAGRRDERRAVGHPEGHLPGSRRHDRRRRRLRQPLPDLLRLGDGHRLFGLADGHLAEQRRHDQHGLLHGHTRYSSADRPVRRPRRRPVLHSVVRPALD